MFNSTTTTSPFQQQSTPSSISSSPISDSEFNVSINQHSDASFCDEYDMKTKANR
jgi:hypothetical protein